MEKENKRKRSKIKIGSVLIIVFVLIYVPSLFHWFFGRNIRTDLIRIGGIEDSINTDACLVRNEEVLNSTTEGRCILEVNEGDKIPVNYRVATVIKDSAQKLFDDLSELDLKIIKTQREKSENQDLFSDDILKIENNIGEKVKLLVTEANSNNLGKAKQIREDIDKLVQKKATVAGGLGTSDVYLNSLRAEKESLKEKISLSTTKIISSSSGIISFKVDGYEGILNPGSIKDLTPEFYDSIKPKGTAETINAKEIEAGKPFAKVIKDFESHIVVSMEPDKAKLLKVDDIIKVRINDINKVIDGYVNYKSNEEGGKYIIAVKINKAISETAGMRKINVDLIRSSFEGLKVSLDSLKDIDYENMKAKIALVKANYATLRDVKIAGYNDKYAIIDSLEDPGSKGISLYDTYVIKPENIREGQVINQ